MQEREIVGYLTKQIIDMLSLEAEADTPIFISESNTKHIRDAHPDAYFKYYDNLSDIIEYPDYVGIAGVHTPSIEYIKRYEVNNELVNVAVRTSKSGVYYLRSLFVIEEGRLNDYLKKGYLHTLDK